MNQLQTFLRARCAQGPRDRNPLANFRHALIDFPPSDERANGTGTHILGQLTVGLGDPVQQIGGLVRAATLVEVDGRLELQHESR